MNWKRVGRELRAQGHGNGEMLNCIAFRNPRSHKWELKVFTDDGIPVARLVNMKRLSTAKMLAADIVRGWE